MQVVYYLLDYTILLYNHQLLSTYVEDTYFIFYFQIWWIGLYTLYIYLFIIVIVLFIFVTAFFLFVVIFVFILIFVIFCLKFSPIYTFISLTSIRTSPCHISCSTS